MIKEMDNFKDNIVAFLACFLVVSCMTFLFMAAFADVENDQALIAITGTLSMVVGFYFGATHKKDDKNNKPELLHLPLTYLLTQLQEQELGLHG